LENIEVAWLFSEMADLLELKGENPYKVKAYRKAAQILKKVPDDLEILKQKNKLNTIEGIGAGLAEKIKEILETGQMQELNLLRKEIPAGLRDILSISGVGPKLARTFWQKLNITSLAELEAAAKSKKLRELPHVGPRTELNIKREIQILRSMGREIPLTIAIPLLDSLINSLKLQKNIIKIIPVGSMRRKRDAVGDLDLLIVSDNPSKTIDFIEKLPEFREKLEGSYNYCSFLVGNGVKVDAWFVSPEQYPLAKFYLTGNKDHVRKVFMLLKQKGYTCRDYHLFKQGDYVFLTGEEQIYELAGMPFIAPELRENKGEIEAALSGHLPDLVATKDVLGDLHIHSNYSDGINSIEELVGRAIKKGYQYIAICDHSKSLGIANGLNVDKLIEQNAEIKRINDRLKDFTVLSGVEVDILADGKLDYPDEVLAKLDLVVASIHSGFKQSKEKMTERIISAMRNKHVDIIGHPTGRIIGRRPAYEIDLDKLFITARETGTILEINSSLDRLDLKDEYVRKAKEMNISLAINTDAHDLAGLDKMVFGVATARRGWLTKQDVVNTLPVKKLLKKLAKNN